MTKIEEIARAIHFRGVDQGDEAWEHCQQGLRTVAIEQALAALQAIREPTEGMLALGQSAYMDGVNIINGVPEVGDEAAYQLFTAMIDHLIQEGKK